MSIGLTDTQGFNAQVLKNYVQTVKEADFQWRPNANATHSYPDVPDHIGEAATEAYECHRQQHYRAAIMLARAVIEATAKDHDIKDGTLAVKIKALEHQKLIRPHIKDGADSVRHFGNDMAHGDFVMPVSAEESELVIDLMGEILTEVYTSRAKIEKARAAVEARKQGTEEG
jgi:hypothetical protein